MFVTTDISPFVLCSCRWRTYTMDVTALQRLFSGCQSACSSGPNAFHILCGNIVV